MKLLFIDETSDSANPDYLGVCAALMDATKYPEIKQAVLLSLSSAGWDLNTEFKGSMIYSQSKGCREVPVTTRIRLAEDIVSLNISDKNSRIRFCYRYSEDGNSVETYLTLVKEVSKDLLGSCLRRTNGKNLVSIYCDARSDVNVRELGRSLDVLTKRGYVICEDIIQVPSNSFTIGITIADIVGYLISRKHNIHVADQLLSDPSSEASIKNGQLQKLIASKQILSRIKRIRIIPVVGVLDVDKGRMVSGGPRTGRERSTG